MYVCICRAVRARTITDLIDAGADVARIEAVTGAGTVCGTCRETVADMVRAAAAALRPPDVTDSAAPHTSTSEDGPHP